MTEITSAPEAADPRDGRPPSGSGMVFVCDASAEAERLMGALRSRGYSAVDVPLGLLPNRVRYETPDLVVVDAEAHEAARLLAETRAASAAPLRLVLLGQADGALSRDPSLQATATLVFVRPIDISRTADSLREILGPAPSPTPKPLLARTGRGPVLVASARRPYRTDNFSGQRGAGRSDPFESHWPVSATPSLGPPLPEPISGGDSPSPRGGPMHSSAPPSTDGAPNLSHETRALLDQARRRVLSNPQQLSRPQRLAVEPGDHGSVSAELLAALDEHLGASEAAGGEMPTRSGDTGLTGRGPNRPTDAPTGRTIARRDEADQTNPGGRPPSRGAEDATGTRDEPEPPAREAPMLSLPPLDDLSDLLAIPAVRFTPSPSDGSLSAGGDPANEIPSTAPGGRKAAEVDTIEPGTQSNATAGRPRSVAPEGPLGTNEPFETQPPRPRLLHSRPVEARSDSEPPLAERAERADPVPVAGFSPSPPIEGFALAIRQRLSGALAQQARGGVRRALLRDGDLLTLTSSNEAESLIQFLVARGDLPADAASRGLPRFGRHAGAALVAEGKLRQEDLWSVLRAHAEWLLGLMLSGSEPLVLDQNAPQRLLEEPAVFGGAAGAEIYVDVLQRVMQPAAAFERLGAGERQLGWGAHAALLAESGLSAEQDRAIHGVLGQPLGRVRDKTPQLLVVLCALAELEILTAGGGPRPQPRTENFEQKSAEMDDAAFQAAVQARRALVDEGDYFVILGVARSATRYEIDRARDHWRREFDASRLSGRNAHLVPELRLVLDVVDEAHLVLSDDVRRERYRRALENFPA